MKILSRLMLCLAPVVAWSAPPSPAALARKDVEAAIAAVTASARPHGEEAESRALRLNRVGFELLGRGYNVTETRVVLERMDTWLRGLTAAKIPGKERDLLIAAARAADEGITDGPGSRGAGHWADFITVAVAAAPPGLTRSGR